MRKHNVNPRMSKNIIHICVYICIYMCIYMYIYVNMYIYVYVYVYIHVYIYIYISQSAFPTPPDHLPWVPAPLQSPLNQLAQPIVCALCRPVSDLLFVAIEHCRSACFQFQLTRAFAIAVILTTRCLSKPSSHCWNTSCRSILVRCTRSARWPETKTLQARQGWHGEGELHYG